MEDAAFFSIYPALFDHSPPAERYSLLCEAVRTSLPLRRHRRLRRAQISSLASHLEVGYTAWQPPVEPPISAQMPCRNKNPQLRQCWIRRESYAATGELPTGRQSGPLACSVEDNLDRLLLLCRSDHFAPP